MNIDAVRAAILALLAERAPETTICPSEVARKTVTATSADTAADWRIAMPIVHAAVDQLVDQGMVQLSWKGRPLLERAGPYRIATTIGDEASRKR